MLSRIAEFGILIATAVGAWSVVPRAFAEGGVQVTPVDGVVQNPFTRQSSAPPQPTAAPPEESGPRTYQNPFSASASSAITSMPRQNTLSRWRRPTQLPGAAAATNQLSPAATAPPEANSSWDILTPTQLEAVRDKALAPQASGQTSSSPAPPDPTSYGPEDLQQPGWLVPMPASAKSESKPPMQIPYSSIGVRPPLSTTAGDGSRPATAPTEPPLFGVRQPDPFEAADESQAVVSDTNGAKPSRPQVSQFVKPAAEPIAASPPAQKVATPPAQKVATPPVQKAAAPAVAAATPAECYERAQRAGETAQSVKELSQVVQLCQQGLAAHPPRDLATRLGSLGAWARNRRGEIQSEAGHDAEALADFNGALQLDPNCWLALHNRAVSLAQQGQGADALRDFNRVIQLSPGMAIAYRNRGELLASMGRSEEAIADYGRAIAQLPEEADLYQIRGHALHRLGRYQEALADLDRAIKLAPHDADAFTHRGNVYAELGDYERATADFQHALEANANCTDAYRSLAWLQSTCPDERFRDPERALNAAERAAKLSPAGNCFVLDALAAAHANAGNFEAAVHYQKLAMNVAPTSFSPQFSERLALYEQHQPYRNEVAGGAVDRQVHAASLEAPPAGPAAR